jgi:LPS-assembly protein
MCTPGAIVDPPETLVVDDDPDEPTQVEITAGQVDLSSEEDVGFFDQVEFRYGDRSISAENAIYDRARKSIDVNGTVTYFDPNMTVFGEDAEIDTENEEIRFTGAGFNIPQRSARGSADTINISSDRTITLQTVNFTTCPEDQVDWELMATEIDLDIDRGFGTARGVKLEFKGFPILYSPYLTFPIDNQRKSGLLTPKFSEHDRTGLDISAPYYLNLAPNYDLTLEPRFMSKRGVQLKTEFRYLLPSSNGRLNFEYLPEDSNAKKRRSYLTYDHETLFGHGWQIVASLADVSDDGYFEDLGDSQTAASQTHLNRYIDISYQATNWSLLSRFQSYQTIDSLIPVEDRPYKRVPQILFKGRWSGDLFQFESTNEIALFDRDVGATGWRLDSTEEISASFRRPGMYLTPGLALRQTNYQLDSVSPGDPDSFSRTLPAASVDAGLVFERRPEQDSAWLQTIEPRLLYVHVPFEEQSGIPIFDTIEPDFNLVQLFRKYQYLGADRISDANQLSLGVTARLIDNRSGRERVSATLGQTRYLDTQRVSLPDRQMKVADESDYIAEVSIHMSEAWRLDAGYQWDSETNSTTRAETSIQFAPADDRYAAFSYRSRKGFLEQGDLSLMWPVGQSWRVIGHYSYSFLEKETLDRFLGLEYESCCWRLRLIGRRYISRRTGESDGSISVQLQLRGFSDEGGAPEELLDRGILGYRGFDNTL